MKHRKSSRTLLCIASLFAGSAHAEPLIFSDNDRRPIETVTYRRVSTQDVTRQSPANSGADAKDELSRITKRPGDQCSWDELGEKWGVSPSILYAIAKTESNFNPQAINRNANDSEDVGMMQINSSWFRKLSRQGISREDLFDPCVSLDVAGWVMADNIRRLGLTWKAVGAYNAISPHKQERYVRKVFNNLPRQAKVAAEN